MEGRYGYGSGYGSGYGGGYGGGYGEYIVLSKILGLNSNSRFQLEVC